MVKNQSAQKDEQGVLEATAQAIGSTLGSLAVKTGIAKPPAAVAHAESQARSGHKHPNRKARRATKKK
ncbi:MAG TPA: hypothetical protein VNV82_07960 [Bryobacteraceae bacterium]|jgi:hypothetical protein|nr:hypothetical protein [Bryobacteraceae bacterium]